MSIHKRFERIKTRSTQNLRKQKRIQQKKNSKVRIETARAAKSFVWRTVTLATTPTVAKSTI